uniref:Uncharacterized protein n=1 Tax=Micrurus lemniscatus lemniscatus TaxID=129467 RepID=A0A2D4J9P0_MICLE
MARKLKLGKQYYYENVNKSGRWLSHKLKKEQEKRTIIALQNENGILCPQLDQKKIIAQNFFANLYKKEEILDENITQYFEGKELPNILETARELLNDKITLKEAQGKLQEKKLTKLQDQMEYPQNFTKNSKIY